MDVEASATDSPLPVAALAKMATGSALWATNGAFLLSREGDSFVEILHLAVCAPSQRRGIGLGLLRAVCASAARLSKPVLLLAPWRNRALRRLCEKGEGSLIGTFAMHGQEAQARIYYWPPPKTTTSSPPAYGTETN